MNVSTILSSSKSIYSSWTNWRPRTTYSTIVEHDILVNPPRHWCRLEEILIQLLMKEAPAQSDKSHREGWWRPTAALKRHLTLPCSKTSSYVKKLQYWVHWLSSFKHLLMWRQMGHKIHQIKDFEAYVAESKAPQFPKFNHARAALTNMQRSTFFTYPVSYKSLLYHDGFTKYRVIFNLAIDVKKHARVTKVNT